MLEQVECLVPLKWFRDLAFSQWFYCEQVGNPVWSGKTPGIVWAPRSDSSRGATSPVTGLGSSWCRFRSWLWHTLAFFSLVGGKAESNFWCFLHSIIESRSFIFLPRVYSLALLLRGSYRGRANCRGPCLGGRVSWAGRKVSVHPSLAILGLKMLGKCLVTPLA